MSSRGLSPVYRKRSIINMGILRQCHRQDKLWIQTHIYFEMFVLICIWDVSLISYLTLTYQIFFLYRALFFNVVLCSVLDLIVACADRLVHCFNLITERKMAVQSFKVIESCTRPNKLVKLVLNFSKPWVILLTVSRLLYLLKLKLP